MLHSSPEPPAQIADRSGATGIPEAWPLLMSQEQACAYLGLSRHSFSRVCRVPPVDLGVRLLRWRRPDIDAWIAGLPTRLVGRHAGGDDVAAAPPAAGEIPADERRFSAVEKARHRAQQSRGTSCRARKGESPSCSGSRRAAA